MERYNSRDCVMGRMLLLLLLLLLLLVLVRAVVVVGEGVASLACGCRERCCRAFAGFLVFLSEVVGGATKVFRILCGPALCVLQITTMDLSHMQPPPPPQEYNAGVAAAAPGTNDAPPGTDDSAPGTEDAAPGTETSTTESSSSDEQDSSVQALLARKRKMLLSLVGTDAEDDLPPAKKFVEPTEADGVGAYSAIAGWEKKWSEDG